jgi:hypothetical protein
MPTSPRVFVSYSWDNDLHKKWVIKLATHLRQDGVDVRLDYWDAQPGDLLPEFMEQQVRDADNVVIVCTPNYKRRSEARKGGVGYEGSIITSEIFAHQNHRKFIPVLASGSWRQSAVSWLIGKSYLDLGNPDNYATGYKELLTTLLGARPKAPLLGPIPPGYKSSPKRTIAEPDFEYDPGRNPNVIIFDSEGVIYGNKLLRHCIETRQTVKAVVFRGISIEVLLAYLRTHFPKHECVQKVMESKEITPRDLEAISDNIQLTVADGMYMWEFQKYANRKR